MPAWPGATISSTTFSVLPIPIVAVSGRRHPCSYGDPTYTAFHCRRSCVSAASGQSAARCHISSNARCFLETPQNLPFFAFIFFLAASSLAVLYTVYSDLAILYIISL